MSQKKQIFKLNVLKKLLTDENSCVSIMQSTRLLALPPFFLTDMKSGILYLLNSMLKKYDRSLGGIVIGYQNIKILMDENTGIIPIGTSEMEVNISVEFYIFQPKIGSYLEGVINKKSDNHIGCLVHQYFNATILKPEDVIYEDWICKNFNVDDKIIFKVIDLDFTTLLPYIEGIYDGRLSLHIAESSANCDMDNMTPNSVNKSCKNEVSFSNEFLKCKTNSDKISDDDFLDVKKVRNKLKSEQNPVKVKSNLKESRSFTDLEIKKKEEKISDTDTPKADEVESPRGKEVSLDKMDSTLQEDEKKKRKKRKRNKDENNEQESLAEDNIEKKSEESTLLPSHIQEKLLEVEDENSNDFVKISKSKKEKKMKIQNEESFQSFNKTNEKLPSEEVEDNILYSTQLEPALGSKKMKISFCSPIPQHQGTKMPTEDRAFSKSTTSPAQLHDIDNDTTAKETKKKQKKRKREVQEELEDSPSNKKMKMSNASSSKTGEVNGSDKKSMLQIMMEQLCQEQLNRVKEELNMSSSDKEEKKKKKKKKREKEQDECVEFNKSLFNGEDVTSELQNTLSELFRKELQKAKEQLSIASNEIFKESKKKVRVKKEEKETPKERGVEESSKMKESENVKEKKSDIKNVVDELCQEQLKRVKGELSLSHKGNVKEEKKKKKSTTNNQETPRENTHDSLYDKLLSEAKNAMDFEKMAIPILPPAAESGKKKKDSELSDVSTSSSRKKKSKHRKQKIEDFSRPSKKYKNGSMYDAVATPEKVNPDRSLFCHASPMKKKKEVNGADDTSGISKVQNMLDEFYREEIKRLKSESDRDSSKGSGKVSKKKSATEEKSQNKGGKEESLYEKLLRQAKSLIDIGDASLLVKKEKKAKKHKKTVQDCVNT